jgi:hypothetical protein
MYDIEENDNYRVRLAHDDSGEKPYDEGAVPILSRPFRSYGERWEAVNDQADGLTGLLNALGERFNEDEIERFLKIFVGAYSVRWDSSDNCRYLAFDTPEWREKVGLTDEYLATAKLDREKLAEGSLTEILAWANGEVYGYILERKVTGRKVYDGQDINDAEPFEEWQEVESCWGFYGWDYAEEEAKSIFKSYTEK